MQTKQKDIIIIVSMLLLAITAFLVVHFILKNKTYENSLIKVNYDTIVTIYFEKEKIVQTIDSGYGNGRQNPCWFWSFFRETTDTASGDCS